MNFKNKKEIFYPLAQSSWDYTEHNAIIDQLYTGNLTMGEKVENFEKRFAEHFGAKYAMMVNSGSSANLLIVAALFYYLNMILKMVMKSLFLL